MGYIPLPEMTNVGQTRVDERRILLCHTDYFDAKKNCFYVVPFNRDDDPVDSFFTRVKQKHNRIRGGTKLKFKPPRFQEKEEPLDPVILEDFPKPRRVRNTTPRKEVELVSEKPKLISRNGNSKKPKPKIHFRGDNQTACGLQGFTPNTFATTNIEAVNCKHCLALLTRKPLETSNA